MKNFFNQLDRLKADVALSTAHDKFIKGESIDDDELKILIEFYKNAEGILSFLGTHYHHAWIAVRQNLETLERFMEFRKNHRL